MAHKLTISVEDAAKIIEKNPQYIRYGLRQNRLPFGSAVQKPNGRWSYNIIRSKFLEYAGLEEGG